MCAHNASEQTCLQGFASAVFKHKAALRTQSEAAQAAGKNIIFACLSMLLYHRNAAFAMSSIRTKPVLYPNDTQYKPNRRIQLRNFSAAPFGVWSLGELSRCVKGAQGFFYTDKPVFRNPCASLCGQTFDTPLPLSLFFSAERSGRLKIVRELYRLCFLRSPVYRDIHRKCCRSRAWFSLPL